MHLFTSHRENTKRYFANFDLPLNPICWLLGHSARGEVKEWRFNIAPSLFIRCRWCDARWTNPVGIKDTLADGSRPQKADYEALEARRVEVFRRDPRMVEANASGRQGYAQNRLELSLEVVDRLAEVKRRGLAKTMLDHTGFKFHVGDRGSETPFDGYVDLGVAAAYWGVGGVGGRLAEFIGRGQKRNLSARVHGGSLWWELWYDDESGNAPDETRHRCDSWRQPKVWPWSLGRRKHRGWMCLRDGNIDLNPLTAFWGSPKPTREALGTADAFVEPGDFHGDTYLVNFKLERNVWAREHGPWFARRSTVTHSIEWDAGKGIPVRNHDWKGDEILSGHMPFPEDGSLEEWLPAAAEALLASVRRDRNHYRYSPPKQQEASS